MPEKEFKIHPDSALWNSFRNGSIEAFNLIYRENVQDLFKYGKKFTQDQDFIKDCIHDVFFDLQKYRKGIRETDNIRAYLYKSLKNLLLKSNSK